MLIERIVNEPFKSNTYIISDPGSHEVIIVDPAGDDEYVLAFIKERRYIPRFVILTHEHFDHITGTVNLKKHYPECSIVCSIECAERIINPKLNMSFYRNEPYVSAGADVVIDKNGTISWIHPVECYCWEGHSPGGMIYNINGNLFCGDQFIKGFKTITNLPGGKKEKVKECLDFLKGTFPLEFILYPGHGDTILLNDLEIC